MKCVQMKTKCSLRRSQKPSVPQAVGLMKGQCNQKPKTEKVNLVRGYILYLQDRLFCSSAQATDGTEFLQVCDTRRNGDQPS